MDSDDNYSEKQVEDGIRTKADVLSSFILQAPPGAFHEVLNDINDFMQDDEDVKKNVTKVFPKYTKSQLTPVLLENTKYKILLTEFNDKDGRFVDPRSKQSFLYDHVTGMVSDLQPWEPDTIAEPWRSALESEWTIYSVEHFHEGACSVFSSSSNENKNIISIHACLEGHQFQPKKFWNGRWRSIWNITFDCSKDKKVDLKGLVKLHVHYYEDGNVQLVSSKRCDQKIDVNNPIQFASDIVTAVKKFENSYQRAISENYQTMSDTTFKTLRRPLPVIRSKMEWNKIMGYKIGSELKNLY